MSQYYGIDVSAHQGKINWTKVKGDGKSFAILKASEGETYRDPTYQFNYQSAKAAGLVVGPYHYFRPGIDMQTQLNNFRGAVRDLAPGDLIPWVDVEDAVSRYEGGEVIPFSRIAADLSRFLPMADKAFGCTVGIYTGGWFWDRLAMPVQRRPLWVAWWDTNPGGNVRLPIGWTNYAVQQYSSEGVVSGIGGAVDLDHVPGSLDALRVGGEDTNTDLFRRIREILDILESRL